MAGSSRKAEVVYIGDAASIVRASQQAESAVGKSAAGISKHHKTISSSFTSMAKNAVMAGAGFAAAYAGIAGAKKAIDATEELTKETLALHHVTGLSVQSASKYAAVAQVNGIEARSLNMAFGTLSKSVQAVSNVHAGLTKSAKAQGIAFSELGIPMKQIIGLHGNMDATMKLVISKFEQMPGSTAKTAAGMALFGRGWQTLVPLMHSGALGLQEQMRMAEQMGATLGGKTVKSLVELRQAQERAKYATLGMQLAFGEYLAPALTKVMTFFGRFVNQMRTGTGAGGDFVNVVRRIGDVLIPVGKFLGQHPHLIAGAVVAWGAYKIAGVTAALSVDAALSPVGLTVAALSVAGFALATHWKSAMNVMWDATKAAVNPIIDALNAMVDAFNATIGQLTGQIAHVGQLTGQAYGNTGRVQPGIKLYTLPGGAGAQPGANVPGSPGQSAVVKAAAKRYGIDPNVLWGVYGNETHWGSDVNTSSAGAKGAFQFISGTAKQYHYPYTNKQNAGIFSQQANAAAHYLSDLLRQNGGDVSAALQQYSGNTPGYAGNALKNGKSLNQLLAGYGVGPSAPHGKHVAAALGVPAGVVAMLGAAQGLVGSKYTFGGGHGGWDPIAKLKQIGIDCSGFVSQVLHKGGVLSTPQDTVSLPHAKGIGAGQGRFVTLWDRPLAGGSGHVIMDIMGKWFESGGNKKFNPHGGVTQLTAAQASGELAGGGFKAFHPTALNALVKGGQKAGQFLSQANVQLGILRAQAQKEIKIKLAAAQFQKDVATMRKSVRDLATQAAQAWRTIQQGKIDSAHSAALSAIEGGPLARELAGLQATDAAAADAQQQQQLHDALIQAQASGDKAAINKAQDDITAYARQQRENQLTDAIQKAKDQADAEQQAANDGLDKQTQDFENSLTIQFGMLTDQLAARKITYAQYASDVNAILSKYGLAAAVDPSSITGGVGSAAGLNGIYTHSDGPQFANLAPGYGVEYDHGTLVTLLTPTQMKAMGRASGGPVLAGTSYIVGESGRELFTPGVSGSITPAGATRTILSRRDSGGNGGPAVHIDKAYFTGTRAARAFADRLAYRAAIGTA